MTAPGGTARLEVMEADDRHAPAVAEFIRSVWTPEATAESVVRSRADGAAGNVAEPGKPPPTFIAIQAGRVFGYVTTIPIRLWDGRRDWPAYWIKGLMVLPEFRNGPIGYLILKAATARLPRTGALAVAPPARRLFEALGYKDLGAIPNLARPLAPHRILNRIDLAGLTSDGLPGWAPKALRVARVTGLSSLAGWVGGGVLRASASALRGARSRFRTRPFDPGFDGAQLDALWEVTRDRLTSGVVRDSRYLRDRYSLEESGPYVWLAASDEETLAGIAILRRPRAEGDPRLRGIRVAALADLLYAPENPAAGLALLGAVERTARSLGADLVLASTPVPPLQRLLRRQWYLPAPGNIHFLFRDVADEETRFGQTLADWWLTRGDGAADEVF